MFRPFDRVLGFDASVFCDPHDNRSSLRREQTDWKPSESRPALGDFGAENVRKIRRVFPLAGRLLQPSGRVFSTIRSKGLRYCIRLAAGEIFIDDPPRSSYREIA